MRSPWKMFFSVLLAGFVIVSGCSETQPATPPDTAGSNQAEAPVDNPPPPPAEPVKQGPRLLSMSLGEEGKDGEVYLLPIPVTLRAWIEGAEGLVQWRIFSDGGFPFRYLTATQIKPEEWAVEWGNPLPPPSTPVWLELWVEVAPDVPESPEYIEKLTRRFAVLSKVLVRSAW